MTIAPSSVMPLIIHALHAMMPIWNASSSSRQSSRNLARDAKESALAAPIEMMAEMELMLARLASMMVKLAALPR